MKHNLRQNDLGEFECHDCGQGLDEVPPVLVAHDEGVTAICPRCALLRRARLAAAESVDTDLISGTYGVHTPEMPPEAA
jgi:hypothetical protein